MTMTSVRVLKAKTAFKAPGIQINGLEAVHDGLWLSDQQNNRTYLIDFDGYVLTSFASPARNASGTSFGTGSVWVASNVRPAAVFRHDPYSGHCTAAFLLPNPDLGGVHGLQWRPYELGVTPPPPPEKKPELHPTAPGGKPYGLPGSSGTLWVTRPGNKTIDHVDAETGALLGTIPFPVMRSHGLYWAEEDSTLNVSETNHGHVYKLNPKNGDVLDEWMVEGLELHAMTRDARGRIWIGDAATNMIHVIEP